MEEHLALAPEVDEVCLPTLLPDALSRKCPRAGHQRGWQFVFPSKKPVR
jgi:hypothetical protein